MATSFVQQVIQPENGNVDVNGIAIVQRTAAYGSPDAGATLDTPSMITLLIFQ